MYYLRRDRRIFRPNWVDDERLHSPAVAVLNSRVRAALRREEWPSILARERERERGPAVLEFVGDARRGIYLALKLLFYEALSY